MVAGGNHQCAYIDKEDASSPTTHLESVLLMATIDAKEACNVAIIDILNAFVQTCLKQELDKCIMVLQGCLAVLMLEVALDVYGPHACCNKKGELVIYVQLLNDLYGIMHIALLYYQHFCKDICSIDFKINPYDPCIANKIVKGKQLTLVWHVDDIKVSHVNPNVVTHMVEWL